MQKRKREDRHFARLIWLVLAVGIMVAVVAWRVVMSNTQMLPSQLTLTDGQLLTPGQQLMLVEPVNLYYLPSPDGKTSIQLPTGAVVRLMNAPKTVNGVEWLRVFSISGRGWMPVTVEGRPVMSLVAGSIAYDPANEAEFFRHAALMFSEQRYDEALSALKMLLHVYPANADTLQYLAETYSMKSQNQEALDAINQALELAPDRAALYRSRGAIWSYTGDFDAANADIDRALELEPNYAAALFTRAYMLSLNGGDWEKAYLHVLDIDPAYDNVYFNIGAQYEKNGDTAKALAAFKKAIALNPYSSEVYNEIGKIYLESGQIDEAYQHLTWSINTIDVYVGGGKGFPYSNRAIIELNNGQVEAAVADLEISMEYTPDNANAWYNLGTGYGQLERYDEAVMAYTQAETYDYYDKVSLYYNRGNANYKLQDYVAAVDDLTEAIDASPNFLGAIEWRGNAYDEMGEYELAMADYERVVSMKPDYPTVYFNMGVSYYLQERYDDAVVNYKHAIELNPFYAEAHYGLGQVYYVQGKLDDARTELQMALTINPRHKAAQKLLAKLDAQATSDEAAATAEAAN